MNNLLDSYSFRLSNALYRIFPSIVSIEGIQGNILVLRLINSVHCQLSYVTSITIVILTVACMEGLGVMVNVTDTCRNAIFFVFYGNSR